MLLSVPRSLPPVFIYCRRTLFSFPDFSSFSTSESKSKTYHEERILPYSAKEIYAVVADVASYPKFVPFCTSSRTDGSALARAMHEKTVFDAELTVGFMNFTESYVSTVICTPYESVQAFTASSTPLFKSLSTTWKFHGTASASQPGTLDNPSCPTLVSYDLRYEFVNPIHAATSTAFFGQVASKMITAFEDRCTAIYGQRNTK